MVATPAGRVKNGPTGGGGRRAPWRRPTAPVDEVVAVHARSVAVVLAAAAPTGGAARPSVPSLLLDWHADPLVLAGLLAVGLLYAAGLRRLAARGQPWPALRTVCFMGGLVVIEVALQSALATYDTGVFSAHVIQHMALTMAAPPLLALGAPITLALMATTKPVRQRIVRVVHSAPLKVLGHPLFAWLIFTLSLYALYYSSLFALSLRNQFVHELVHLHFILVGLLFWWPIVAVDPTRWRLHPAARLGYLFLMLPFHAFLGVAIMGSGALLAPEMAQFAPAWLGDPLADQRVGGGILWGVGDLISIVAALGIMVAWANQDEKEARRIDRRLDREQAGPLRPVRPGQRQPPPAS
jgi:cytochrome c oxidase assembly factor CtaG